MEYAFIHIPKCAGHSIKKAIKNNYLPIQIFDHAIIFKKIPTDLKQLIVIRDPIDRFSSAFFYVKNIHFKDRLFSTPEELIHGLINNTENSQQFTKPFGHSHHVNGKKINTDWVFHPQIGWVDNPHTIILYDTLEEDFQKLFNVKLPLINNSSRIDFEYSKKSIDYLKIRYMDDFKLYEKERDKK